jgi:hypothetical protein
MASESFTAWCSWGGKARARYWYMQDYVNLERARYSHWVMKQRHWLEEPYLHECLADLSVTLHAKRRTKRHKRIK